VSFTLSGLSISKGTAVLFNATKGTLVGRKAVSGTGVTVDFANRPSRSDRVDLAVWSHNYRPYFKSFIVDGVVAVGDDEAVHAGAGIPLRAIPARSNGAQSVVFSFAAQGPARITLRIYGHNGKTVHTDSWREDGERPGAVRCRRVWNSAGSGIPAGTYIAVVCVAGEKDVKREFAQFSIVK
jgi:hypothetical protein